MLDNCATHKTPEVQAWLEKPPRLKLHFTLTSALWLTMVERCCAAITPRRIGRGGYPSADDLEVAICDCLGQHNTKPKPLVWTKSAEHILTRERPALDKPDEISGNRKQAPDPQQ